VSPARVSAGAKIPTTATVAKRRRARMKRSPVRCETIGLADVRSSRTSAIAKSRRLYAFPRYSRTSAQGRA
jgi:hypothetical protein